MFPAAPAPASPKPRAEAQGAPEEKERAETAMAAIDNAKSGSVAPRQRRYQPRVLRLPGGRDQARRAISRSAVRTARAMMVSEGESPLPLDGTSEPSAKARFGTS